MGLESARLSRRTVLAGGAAVATAAAVGVATAPAAEAVAAPVIKRVAMQQAIAWRYNATTRVTTVTRYKALQVYARFYASKIYLKNSKGVWTQVPYVWSSSRKALVFSRYLQIQIAAAAAYAKAAADPTSGIKVIPPTTLHVLDGVPQQRLGAPPAQQGGVRRDPGRPRRGEGPRLRRMARAPADTEHRRRRRVRRLPRPPLHRHRRHEAPRPVDGDLAGEARPRRRDDQRLGAAPAGPQGLHGPRDVEQAPAPHRDGGLLGQPLQRHDLRRRHGRVTRPLRLHDQDEGLRQVHRPPAPRSASTRRC